MLATVIRFSFGLRPNFSGARPKTKHNEYLNFARTCVAEVPGHNYVVAWLPQRVLFVNQTSRC